MTNCLKMAIATTAVCGQTVKSSILKAAKQTEDIQIRNHLIITLENTTAHHQETIDMLNAADQEKQTNEHQANDARLENRLQVR